MRRTHQGSYRLDDSRSAIYLPRTKGLPKNTEIEATLTLVQVPLSPRLAALDQATPQARADATAALRVIQQKAAAPLSSLQQSIRDDIDRFLKRPDAIFKPIAQLPTPPGDPIGTRSVR